MVQDGEREHAVETVIRAEEVYCVDGLTFERTAEVLDAEGQSVAVSTLKRWSAKYNWPAKREELRTALMDIKRNRILLTSQHLAQCLKNLDNPMQIYAAARLQEIQLKAEELAVKGLGRPAAMPSPAAPARDIATPDDAAQALEEAIKLKLGRMLSDPAQVDLAAVKNVRQALDLIGDLRRQASAGGERPHTLDPETLRIIKEQIYGL